MSSCLCGAMTPLLDETELQGQDQYMAVHQQFHCPGVLDSCLLSSALLFGLLSKGDTQ